MERRCEICGNVLKGRQRKYCSLECAKNYSKGTKKDKPKKITRAYADNEVLASKGNTKQCCTCEYWDKLHLLCDYYGKTGQLRMCEPSPNCTKYERRKKQNGRL